MSINEQALGKLVHDLQSKLQEATRMVASVQAQIQAREREKKLSELTNKELSSLQADTVTYKSVGKMFVQEPLNDLTKELSERAKDMTKELEALDKKRIYWERNKTEAQGNLQELIRQIQQAQGA
ncbi:Prefoldin [Lobosporangium transversale]|uniref:Prefoldin n=1 Tax=Lobosporangium transversale TaxID=64571 RepID=A0A1Y2GF64_9FUNG|nr:Prefoldin [Lobosporangium transversale]ORZ09094.1 Prefoldin [Lobosporangium transversale]|eukprot:XP_021878721.1 Prefoldin [Lobosporangium transversale]